MKVSRWRWSAGPLVRWSTGPLLTVTLWPRILGSFLTTTLNWRKSPDEFRSVVSVYKVNETYRFTRVMTSHLDSCDSLNVVYKNVLTVFQWRDTFWPFISQLSGQLTCCSDQWSGPNWNPVGSFPVRTTYLCKWIILKPFYLFIHLFLYVFIHLEGTFMNISIKYKC